MIASHVIEFNEQQIGDILRETEQILRSGQVILGEKTREFEDAYAKKCGRLYGVAVGSDTAAFEMQLKTVDVRNEYVLFPALAFPSILESVVNAGGKPFFVDADLDAHLFASTEGVKRAAEACMTLTGKYPRALILMHTGGLIAKDAAEITDWCERAGIVVLEDAAHSFGAELYKRQAGSYGLSSAFSLYATKPMHACEGGMIVTDDPDLVEECRIYRNYGRTQDFGRSVIVRHGYSWRMTEIQAVIGLSNLTTIDDNIAARRGIMRHYDSLIEQTGGVWNDVPGLRLASGMEPNGYRYIRLLPKGWNGPKRQVWKHDLKEQYGIDLPGEVYELPTHKQPIWTEQYGHLMMPVAEDFCDRHFALPVYASLTGDQRRYIVSSVTESLEKAL
jgi:perosamine synthetase